MKNLLRDYWQHGSAVLILIFISINFEFARDYVSGRLEYKWLFAELSNKDVKLFTILITIGAGAGFLVNAIIQNIRTKTKEATNVALEERNRFIKFGIVGLMGVGWKTLLLWQGVEKYGISEYIVIIPIFFIIFFHNYILNTIWSFRGLTTTENSLFKYLGINIFSGLVYFSCYYSFLLLHTHYIFASLLGVGAAAFINFAGSRLGVWKTV